MTGHRFGVPASLLEAICYFEGHLSDHGGAPSSAGGYGCMDLIHNSHLDTVTYDTANRPSDLPLLGITVHDTEETLDNTIATFWNQGNGVSIHYVVDTDGTVYQCLHEKDVAFQNGNFWYNQRTIGIEHVGVDATGYQWYNAAEYLGSAKLVAYLLTKYNIPLDHEHVMSHGTTPAPSLSTSPNHVDPGPYWLWDYYLGLINQQNVPFNTGPAPSGVIRLNPASGQQPGGSGGTETTANFNFFYLYTQPSMASPRLPAKGSPGDITDVSNNVETMLSYDTLAQQPDAAGTGDTMYEIWYGAQLSSSSWSATGTKAWIAVPPGAAEQGYGTVVTLSKGGKKASVYGKPGGTFSNVIGSTPSGSAYLSPWSVTVSGATWYAINYNHRQAWVPDSEVTSTRTI
jgi:N-acetylmuramoyl-L-alanine amidase